MKINLKRCKPQFIFLRMIKIKGNGKKESLYLILLFLGVMNGWKGLKIRVKIREIKSAHINAALS